MIHVEGLSKIYGAHQVLKDVTLDVNEGQVLSIIGHSGSGKSTCLRCLNLLEKPDAGLIRIDGAELRAESYSRRDVWNLRSKSAMVFQNYNLFKNKTALQNVTTALVVAQKVPPKEAAEIGMALLERVGLAAAATQYPATLSGGQQQRVAIARALAVKPRALFFDEPTSALDPELVHEVLAVMLQLAQEKTTMIIVTHEMDFARKVSDQVLFMMDGVVVERGTATELFDHPRDERTQRFLRTALNAAEYTI